MVRKTKEWGDREKMKRGRGETGRMETTLSRSSRIQAGPWRGFWIKPGFRRVRIGDPKRWCTRATVNRVAYC